MISNPEKPSFIRKYYPVLVAFLVPILILLLIYITREIYPFGDQMYLRSDMYHQYAPFLKLFQSTLKNGGSLSYTWNIGLGTNFLSTYAYYLASPLNWITVILPTNYIPEIMSIFIILKSGLMAATCTIYLLNRFQRYNVVSSCFGIFYALSGYMAAYSWNVMWLDCLILLPLIVLGLERLMKERKFLLYTICFALSVISNYYIAIMICIFTLIYFIYLMIAETTHSGARDVFRKIGRYLLFSLIGGCLGALIFLPALLTLFGTASADSSFPTHLTAYYNLLELFAHGMMNTKITMMKGYVPNIYAGISAFALIPLFWLNKKIPIKEKAGKSVLMGILLFSFTFNIPAFIWHGFHFPNSLPSRQSFIYIFLILVMGYEALIKIKKLEYRRILICFGIAILSVFLLQVLYDGEDYPMSVAYASAGFLIVYGVIVLLMKQKKKMLCFVAVLALLVASISEATVNMDTAGYGTTNRFQYTLDNDTITYLLNEIPDTDFYRVEKLQRRTKNDGSWSGYRSASIFSSVTSEALSDYYESFGLQYGTNSFSYYGNTPFTSALLGVRYKLSQEEIRDPYLTLEADREGMYLYRSKYSLPLGFMVNETTQAEVNLSSTDPFTVQNDFIDAAKDAAPVFETETKLEGESVSYAASKDGRLFFYMDPGVKNLTVTFSSGERTGQSKTYTNLECPMIIDAGMVERGDEMVLTISDEEVTTFSVIPAMMDEAALNSALERFGENPLEISEFGDTYIKGTVSADKEGMLFTTIPYDKGWSVSVDGHWERIHDFYGAFIQVRLPEGTHTVEFRYQVPGFLAGLIISILALFALVMLTIIFRFRNRRKVTLSDVPEEPEKTDQIM